MLWLSLIPCSAEGEAESLPLAWWALQYTPRVACREGAVLLEVASSLRLFGGAAALRARMRRQLGQGLAPAFTALAWAPTSLAALALSRHSLTTQERPAQPARGARDGDGTSRPLTEVLDALPLQTISAVGAQAQTLARLGCRTLGDVRGLPRAGMARRFGAPLVAALDQAYGLQPEAHDWVTLPEVFDERLELPWRVDAAPALMHGAQHLLQRLQAWLAARHAGVRAVVLRWQHEFGARAAGAGGELVVRTAQPVRRVDHLARLLAEHLAQTTLLAPVGELGLRATEIEALAPPALSLLPPDERCAPGDASGDGWQAVAERLSVRLGARNVMRPVLRGDHRPGHMQAWVPVCAEPLPGAARVEEPRAPYHVPQPSWLLDEPQPLAVRDECPQYQGPLRLLAGPHRIESGWWDDASGESATVRAVVRDYFVAASPRAGLLWVFRSRLPRASAAGAGWFLHGIYG